MSSEELNPSATWEEIKRLAADFQRMQLVECTYKLSERNCIEIVNKLTALNLIDVTHTLDGKEYITKQQISREICDHLYCNNGRIGASNLQSLLNIDISHVENAISDLTHNDNTLIFVAGQLLNREYLNKMFEDINDLLIEKGILLISELSNMYSLPLEFLQQILKDYVGSVIKGFLNETSIYTQSFVLNQKNLLVGALESTIKPIRLSQLKKEYSINMFNDIIVDLLNDNQLNGQFYGTKQESAVYIPNVYTNVQKSYVESFFKQNGYIDYNSLKKLGITDGENYVKALELNKNQQIQYFITFCIGEYLFDQIDSNLEDALNVHGYCDLINLLPSSIDTSKDATKIANFFHERLKRNKTSCNNFIIAETYFVTEDHIESLYKYFNEKMELKSMNDMKNPNVLTAVKALLTNTDTNTKTKSVKSKANKYQQAQYNDNKSIESLIESIFFIDEVTLEKELKTKYGNEVQIDFIQGLCEYLIKPLNNRYVDKLKSKLESIVSYDDNAQKQSNNENINSSKNEILSKKSVIKTIQEKMKTYLLNTKLFSKSIKTFNNEKTQDLLSKHLIKTLCNDMLNELVKYLADEQMITFEQSNFNNEMRNKIIQKLNEPNKTRLMDLQVALDKKSVFEVIELIEKACNDLLELQVKKLDNKKERELLNDMRDTLVKTLENEKDFATILQLVCIILYYDATNYMLNIPGKCVPDVLDSLKTLINEDVHKKLIEFQNIVIKQISKSNENTMSPNENDFDEIVKQVKEFVSYKATTLKK